MYVQAKYELSIINYIRGHIISYALPPPHRKIPPNTPARVLPANGGSADPHQMKGPLQVNDVPVYAWSVSM